MSEFSQTESECGSSYIYAFHLTINSEITGEKKAVNNDRGTKAMSLKSAAQCSQSMFLIASKSTFL